MCYNNHYNAKDQGKRLNKSTGKIASMWKWLEGPCMHGKEFTCIVTETRRDHKIEHESNVI